MTTEEAREILEEEGDVYTDDELRELIAHYEDMARMAIRGYEVLKSRFKVMNNLV